MKSITALALALLTTTAALADVPAFDARVTGHGRPMILIPGLSCPGEVWATTVAHLNDRYECHVLSLAGFAGVPACPSSAPFLESTREAIATYIQERKLERPVVVGHSLGGFLALDLGAKHAGLVGPIVVVDAVPFLSGMMRPGITPEGAKAAAASMRLYFDGLDSAAYEQSIRAGAATRPMVGSDDDHARIVAWSLASDRVTVTNAMTEMFSTDLRDDIAKIQSPTLVLAAWIGYQPYTDHNQTEATFRQQFARLDGVKISITDTARHFIMLDDPQWMFAQIESFLAASTAASN